MNLMRSNLTYIGGYVHMDTRAAACAESISIDANSVVYFMYWGRFTSLALQIRTPFREAPFSYASFTAVDGRVSPEVSHAWREWGDILVV